MCIFNYSIVFTIEKSRLQTYSIESGSKKQDKVHFAGTRCTTNGQAFFASCHNTRAQRSEQQCFDFRAIYHGLAGWSLLGRRIYRHIMNSNSFLGDQIIIVEEWAQHCWAG